MMGDERFNGNTLLDDFSRYLSVKGKVEGSSLRHCRNRVKIFFRWFEKPETAINKETVEDFFFYLKEEKGLVNNSLNTYVFALRKFYDYCIDRRLPVSPFMDGIESFEKIKPIIIPLTVEEEEKLLSVDIVYPGHYRGMDINRMNAVYKAMIRFLMTTGCRYEEAQTLRIQDVDVSAKKVIFRKPKNKEYRLAYIREPLITELHHLIDGFAPEQLVFRNMLGKKIIPTNFGKDLRDRARRAGIKKRVHPHLLRHSYSVALLDEGVGIEKVAQLLGHRDIRTTYENYAHLADKTREKANDMHPLVRQNIPAMDRLKQAIEQFRTHNFDKDPRFDNAVLEKCLALMYESIKN